MDENGGMTKEAFVGQLRSAGLDLDQPRIDLLWSVYPQLEAFLARVRRPRDPEMDLEPLWPSFALKERSR